MPTEVGTWGEIEVKQRLLRRLLRYVLGQSHPLGRNEEVGQ